MKNKNIDTTSSHKNKLSLIIKNRYFILIAIIAVLLVYFTVEAPYFLTLNNIVNILRQIAELGMVSITISLLLISGNMDLSVGSIIGLSAIVTGILLRSGYPIVIAVLVGLVVGIIIGLINGLMVGKLGIQAVVVTIGTQVMFRGLCFIITMGRAVSGFQREFAVLGSGSLLGIPISIWTLVVLFTISYLILERSYMGRYIIAIGNNENTARYTGINISRVKIILFIASGFMAALAGIFILSRISSAEATMGTGYELDIITAALIGGVDVTGGRGKLQGSVMGIFILGILRNGFNLMGVSAIYQAIIIGVLLIIAVYRKGNQE